MKAARITIIAFGSVLFVALVLFVAPAFTSNDARRILQPLDQLVPMAASGWDVRTLDIAESPEQTDWVRRVLRYDDIVYRSFRRGNVEVQVYAAYWKPGSVPYGQAGVHTPDTCWVNAGWTMRDKVNSRRMQVGEYMFKPGEWRCFEVGSNAVQVLFWHLVGEDVHTYEQHGWRGGVSGVLDRLPNFFRDVRRYGFDLAREQIFVRISSNVPFEQLTSDPAFVALMRELQPLGVFEPAA